MNRPVQWRCLTIVVLLSGAIATAPAADKTYTGKFLQVEVGGELSIRTTTGAVFAPLLGVALLKRGQPGYEESLLLLRRIIADREVKVIVITGGAAMRLSVEGTSVNVELVRQGGAWHDPRAAKSGTLEAAQAEARENRRGFWAAAEEPVAPWKWAEHAAELAKAVNLKRAAEFRKSLDVPPENRSAALTTLGRAVQAMGGADVVKQLERAEVQCELSGEISFGFSGGDVKMIPVELAWELPDRLYLNALTEIPILETKLQFGYRVYWNRPAGLVAIMSGTTAETVGSIPVGPAGERTARQIALAARLYGDLLMLAPLADEASYALQASEADKAGAVGDSIEVYPRYLLDPPAIDDFDASPPPLQWLQIQFDPDTKLPVRWQMEETDGYIRSAKPAEFGPLTICTEWSCHDSKDKEFVRLAIKRLELPAKIAPKVFAIPVRKAK